MFQSLRKWLKNVNEKRPREPIESSVLDDISIEDVKKAVNLFAQEKPDGILLNVLIKENHEIDYQLLSPYLKGMPKRMYYMSRETYEIVEDGHQAKMIDEIQKAVDKYIEEVGKFPVLDTDPDMKISYYKLKPYLTEQPTFDTYLTGDQDLITTERPVLH